MHLTVVAIKTAKPKEKAYPLSDGRGLLLDVSPKGLKSWRFRFSWRGKQQITTLGNFPHIPLSNARDLAMEARAKAREGIDPRSKKAAIKALQNAQNEFNAVFEVGALQELDSKQLERVKELEQEFEEAKTYLEEEQIKMETYAF